MTIKIYCASDHAGVVQKSFLLQELRSHGYDPVDLGPCTQDPVDYPDYARSLAQHLKDDGAAYGLLLCGSGIGMSMAANRYGFLRGALCHTPSQSQQARKHNDANVLCLASRDLSNLEAWACLKAFLTTAFEGGRHVKRLEKLKSLGDHKVC